MLVLTLIFDNVATVSAGLATAAVSWSWWTAFKLIAAPKCGAVMKDCVLISGFGQA